MPKRLLTVVVPVCALGLVTVLAAAVAFVLEPPDATDMLGIAALLAAFAIAANAQGYPPPPPQRGPAANVHYGWAEVLRADPVYGTVAQPPQQQCYPQTVTQQDNNHTGGTVLGAIVGGVLGSTVGKGDGRKAATVAGAVAGGVVYATTRDNGGPTGGAAGAGATTINAGTGTVGPPR